VEGATRAALLAAFTTLMVAPDAQRRGYELESLLNDLFTLAKLDPKASFRLIGEQIDGAFTFDGDDYLLEAKWEKYPIPPATLDVFDGKIGRKAAHTRGLLLAINGFQESAIALHSGRASAIILMDGADLMAVLEERIALPDLLRHKRRHAAHTGRVFIGVRDILS
jgi:predicted HTH domain antitoxin